MGTQEYQRVHTDEDHRRTQNRQRAIEERVKVAELMAEVPLLHEKQMIQNEVAVMEMRERLAKVQARARAYTSTPFHDFHEGYQKQT